MGQVSEECHPFEATVDLAVWIVLFPLSNPEHSLRSFYYYYYYFQLKDSSFYIYFCWTDLLIYIQLDLILTYERKGSVDTLKLVMKRKLCRWRYVTGLDI